jgi:hypothetical protein
MTSETNRGRTHPASGTEAPSGASIPSGTTVESDTAARRNPTPSLPLPLPGLSFGIDPKRLLWYGGLAALATVGVLEWPVAAVVGVGSYVAERMAREDALRAARQQS